MAYAFCSSNLETKIDPSMRVGIVMSIKQIASSKKSSLYSLYAISYTSESSSTYFSFESSISGFKIIFEKGESGYEFKIKSLY